MLATSAAPSQSHTFFPTHSAITALVENDDDFDAAIRCLRNAVESQPRGDHLALILALRQLSDESLRPLFLQLVEHLEWQVQVHAVLGLAELDQAAVQPYAAIDPCLSAIRVSAMSRRLYSIIGGAIAMSSTLPPHSKPGKSSGWNA